LGKLFENHGAAIAHYANWLNLFTCGGVAFSLVTMLLYLTFIHVSVSLGSPTIRVMGIVIASLLGILILREPVTWRYVLGVILTIVGVALIVFR
jgi:drug/metabolite transporter (DMT)-like permease